MYRDITTGKLFKRNSRPNMFNGMYKWQRVKPLIVLGVPLLYFRVGRAFFDSRSNFEKTSRWQI